MRTLILAGSFGEAARYARGKSLNHYRYASSAELVSSFQAQRVVELPGFARRLDKHALIAVANRAVRRGAEWVQDEYIPPAPEETPITKLRGMTSFDWLFGAVPTDLRAIGATDDEVAKVEELQATAVRVEQDLVEAEMDRQLKASDPEARLDAMIRSVEAKEPKKPEPKPAAKPKRPRPSAPRQIAAEPVQVSPETEARLAAKPKRPRTTGPRLSPGPPATPEDRKRAEAMVRSANATVPVAAEPANSPNVDDLFEG